MANQPKKELSLFDASNLVVGIMVGVGLYESSPIIASNLPNLSALIAVWLFGGALSLAGALCYAELATRFPNDGGDYIYLSRSWGKKVALLYGWTKLAIMRPGSIAAMAFVFGRYANQLYPISNEGFYALASVLPLIVINIIGVREGKWTQNLLTTLKVLSLIGIILAGILSPSPAEAQPLSPSDGSLTLAVIFVLFAFGGWNEVAYVAAEVVEPKKNIIRSLIIGTVGVTILYICVNIAMALALGYGSFATDETAASSTIETWIPGSGGRVMAVLIAISALGAINGMIFTGARISYALGTEHKLFSLLGVWNKRLGTPVNALIAEAVITSLLILFYFNNENGFQAMVMYTTPAFWFFMILVGLSLFHFRSKDKKNQKAADHFSLPGYPILLPAFILTSAFMTYSSLSYALEHLSYEVFWSVGVFLIGVALLPFSGTHPSKG